MQYKISCTIILNRYLSASALKVFWKLFRLGMQSTAGVWNFSENSSVLIGDGLPKYNINGMVQKVIGKVVK